MFAYWNLPNIKMTMDIIMSKACVIYLQLFNYFSQETMEKQFLKFLFY